MTFLICFFIENIDPKTLYDISKDFIVPAATLFITILGSVCLANKSFRKQKYEAENQEKLNKESIYKALQILDKPILEKLDNIIEKYDQIIQSFEYNKFENFESNKFNLTPFLSIANFGYDKLHSVFKYKGYDDEKFIAFWFAINNVIINVKYVEEYLSYLDLTFSKLSNRLHKINTIIAKDILPLQDKYITPYTDNNLDINDRPQYFAYKLHEIIIENNRSQTTKLSRIKTFTNQLDALRFDKKIAGIMSPDLAQKYFRNVKHYKIY